VEPSLHFVLYIPGRQQAQLHFVNDAGTRTPTDSFLIPRWGGVAVLNPDAAVPSLTAAALRPAFESFMVHLRALLGIHALSAAVPDGVAVVVEPALAAVSAGEVDAAGRLRTVRQAMEAARTLRSLAALLERLPQIEVTLATATKVADALAWLDATVAALAASQYTTAASASRRALAAAEAAFFDPTMVAQQYFPDEHKYAVYLPLVLPVSLPILVAALRECRRSHRPAT